MPTYATPGVYVEEISLLPASVAEVATAIPAFVGYTETADRNGTSLLLKPLRVKSLLEYSQYFGGPASPKMVEVTLDKADNVSSVTIQPRHYLYESLQLFYANGGGPCYIVSVGPQRGLISKTDLIAGLDALRREDEPTMIVMPELMLLESDDDIADVQQRMLLQCQELQDRVAILDVKSSSEERTVDEHISLFRNGIGTKGLRYGAAYYPFVRTTLAFTFGPADIQFRKGGAPVSLRELSTSPETTKLVEQFESARADARTLRNVPDNARDFRTMPESIQGTRAELAHYLNVMREMALRIRDGANVLQSESLRRLAEGQIKKGGPFERLVQRLMALDQGYEGIGGHPEKLGVITDFPGISLPKAVLEEGRKAYGGAEGEADAVKNARPSYEAIFQELQSLNTSLVDAAAYSLAGQAEALATHPLLQRAVDRVKREAAVLPPGAAVAGVYCYVDNTRGVHKAPANVSLSAVVEPVVKLNQSDQENLNVDANAGKSVNAIRAFSGKGTLVWGARTLAGNDNEWRYVSVRRFFNMVEESIQKSTSWAVFEPHDANTWLKVKASIENYLILKWREGALVGAKPEDAFYVKLGLGETMTAVDVLEGRMNVEIGMAVVRPAEFIILKFMHKMQAS